MNSPRRYESLDSLRGIAAMSVVLYHIPFDTWLTNNAFVRRGYLMVDLFFVLSGFVMYHTYGDRLRTQVQCKAFLVSRFFRIYPLHFVTLLFYLAIECAKYGLEQRAGLVVSTPAFSQNNLGSLISNLLLLQSMHVHPYLTYNFPSWSIGVEFYTYIAFALCMVSLGRGTRKGWALGSLVLAILLYAGIYDQFHKIDVTYDFGFIRCVAGFSLGIFSHFLHRAVSARLPPQVITWATYAVLTGSVLLLSQTWIADVEFAMPPLFALLISGLSSVPETGSIHRALTVPVFSWLGEKSYSLYMLHAAVIRVCLQIMKFALKIQIDVEGTGQTKSPVDPTVGMIAIVCILVVLIVASGLAFKLIEERFRLYGKRLTQPWLKQAV